MTGGKVGRRIGDRRERVQHCDGAGQVLPGGRHILREYGCCCCNGIQSGTSSKSCKGAKGRSGRGGWGIDDHRRGCTMKTHTHYRRGSMQTVACRLSRRVTVSGKTGGRAGGRCTGGYKLAGWPVGAVSAPVAGTHTGPVCRGGVSLVLVLVARDTAAAVAASASAVLFTHSDLVSLDLHLKRARGSCTHTHTVRPCLASSLTHSVG